MTFPTAPDSQLAASTLTALSAARSLLQNVDTAVCFSGAGLSAESGIATFRDTETHALWSRFDPVQLASPEGFAANPATVIDWYNWRRNALAKAQPNAGHLALAQQHQLVQITQNVDNLLQQAGCGSGQIVSLHGDLCIDRCNASCGFQEAVSITCPPPLRRCPQCQAYLRPGVVWFGETLPQAQWQRAENLCLTSQCLLVVGTSASVYPAAGLIEIARQQRASIIVINTHSSGASHLADIEVIGPSAILLPLLLRDLQLKSPKF